MRAGEALELRPYAEGDLWLLERLNSPETTDHLGGPETPERLRDRYRRYVNPPAGEAMFAVLLDGEVVGSIGYWEKDWQGAKVFETGWGVLPEHQGRGIATRAALAVIEKARAEHTRRYLHAFPSVDHPASNAICRKAGFTLLGAVDFEYPPGRPMRCNDWRFDLLAA